MFKKLIPIILSLSLLMSFVPLALAEWTQDTIISIDLGAGGEDKGLHFVDGADGKVQEANKGGVDAIVVPETPPEHPDWGNHIYFDVDDSVLRGEEADVWIAVEYFDETTHQLRLDYDDVGTDYPNKAFALLRDPIRAQLEDTKTWRIAILEVEDTEFQNEGNGGDFRFHIEPSQAAPIYINRVWVCGDEPTEAELLGFWGETPVNPKSKLSTTWASIKK